MNNKILIFGDSITWGASDALGGWANRLKQYCDGKSVQNHQYYCAIYPLGVSGDSTEDLLKRFEQEASFRIQEDDKPAIVFAIGVNDSQVEVATQKNKIPFEEFKNNVQRLITQAKKFSNTIIFLGITPVDNRVYPIPWKATYGYKNNEIQKYNKVLQELIKDQQLLFIDIYNEFMEQDYKSLLADGLHPNTKGHELMFEVIKRRLEEMAII